MSNNEKIKLVIANARSRNSKGAFYNYKKEEGNIFVYTELCPYDYYTNEYKSIVNNPLHQGHHDNALYTITLGCIKPTFKDKNNSIIFPKEMCKNNHSEKKNTYLTFIFDEKEKYLILKNLINISIETQIKGKKKRWFSEFNKQYHSIMTDILFDHPRFLENEKDKEKYNKLINVFSNKDTLNKNIIENLQNSNGGSHVTKDNVETDYFKSKYKQIETILNNIYKNENEIRNLPDIKDIICPTSVTGGGYFLTKGKNFVKNMSSTPRVKVEKCDSLKLDVDKIKNANDTLKSLKNIKDYYDAPDDAPEDAKLDDIVSYYKKNINIKYIKIFFNCIYDRYIDMKSEKIPHPCKNDIYKLIQFYHPKKSEPFFFCDISLLRDAYNDYYKDYYEDDATKQYLEKRFDLYYKAIKIMYLTKQHKRFKHYDLLIRDYEDQYDPLDTEEFIKDYVEKKKKKSDEKKSRDERSSEENSDEKKSDDKKSDDKKSDYKNSKYYEVEEELYRAYNLLCKQRKKELIKRKQLKAALKEKKDEEEKKKSQDEEENKILQYIKEKKLVRTNNADYDTTTLTKKLKDMDKKDKKAKKK